MAFNIPNQSVVNRRTPLVPSNVTPWVRPADWPIITDTIGEIQFIASDLLNCKYTLQTKFDKPTSQNLYIDWGDGTIDTVTTNTLTSTTHTYAVGTGTPCSLGYTTFKARVYVDAGARPTFFKFISTQYDIDPTGVLEIIFGDDTITDANALFKSTFNSYLQHVKLPASIPQGNAGNELVDTFNSLYSTIPLGCPNIVKIDMPTSLANQTSLSGTFYSCTNLLEISIASDAINLINLNNTFRLCTNLTSIQLPSNLNSCTTMRSTFYGCANLSNVDLPYLDNCIDLSAAFTNCINLQSVNFKSLPSGVLDIDLTNTFQNCSSLKSVNIPTPLISGTGLNMQQAFILCSSIEQLTIPNGYDIKAAISAFDSCYSLAVLNLPNTWSVSSLSGTFNNCYVLSEINLPEHSTGIAISFANAFRYCASLGQITIPNSYGISSLSTTFQNCNALTTVSLPNNAQDSLTTMANCFQNCYNLKTVSLPTSLNGVTTIASCFSSASNLESVTFPASMPALTTIGSAFLNCYSLKSLTLPSTTAVSSTSNTFSYAHSLKDLVLPASVAVGNSYSNSFLGANSLQTITFPLTQSTSLTTLQGLFFGCKGLTGAFNTDKLGNNATGSTTYITGSLMGGTAAARLLSLDFTCKFNKFEFNGIPTIPIALQSLRLRNTGSGQYAGTSPQINISYTNLSAAALNQVFSDLPTLSGKTIVITGAAGAATCDTTIATGKGWTVTN